MADLFRDKELDRLVRELNETAGHSAPVRSSGIVNEGDLVATALHEMIRQGASDLIILAGEQPMLRINGRLSPTTLRSFDDADLRSVVLAHATSRAAAMLESEGACDFSIALQQAEGSRGRWRFRVNVHKQRGHLAAAVRALPAEPPSLEQLGLPRQLAELAQSTQGLFLVCGPTGSGKTTTLAALIDIINRNSARHVVTIEDPIEYEHRNVNSLVEQIEIGRDAPSFQAALRSALRQDPDVIMIGEMRDLETVATALRAAETGHLILATLHTSDAAQAIHRIVDVFPGDQQAQIRQQLALSIHAILCQQLIPRTGVPGRVPAVELLIANYAVRQHIRGDRLQQLPTELTLGKRSGMVSMEDSLSSLVRTGTISAEEAQMRMRNPSDLQSYLDS